VQCPEPEVLAAFSRGGLDPAERRAFEAHLDQCDHCGEVLAQLARMFASRRSSSGSLDPVDMGHDPTLADDELEPVEVKGSHLRPGDRLDRYHVLEPVGAGGMGVVYAAYDADLDRKVALKVLHEHGRGDDRAQRRMLREAQAMARLSHPNVITVHEVRVVGERLFISMEFVEGGTLGQWLARERPELSRILAMFRGIGRGLCAAHAAGLVHRDVKPDNVLIGADERPRVTDFGLARPSDDGLEASDARQSHGSGPPSPPLAALAESSRSADTLTRTGALVGTPAYMAPEQFLRQTTTAASDQFGFCVVLYEALYGRRPFPGRTLHQLAANVLNGSVEGTGDDREVPRWLRQVVQRGLSLRPEDRFPSMEALVASLEPAPPRARRRVVLAGLAGAGLIGATLLAAREMTAPDRCVRGQATIDALWTEGAREPIRRALSRGDSAYATQTATRAVERLDAYAAAWSTSHRDACEGYQRGELSDEALDLRGACLDERREELSALLEVLVQPDPKVRRHAVEAIEDLPALSTCEDLEALRARVPLPRDPDQLARVQQLERDLARARALRHAGRYEAGFTVAAASVQSARELDYGPLLAQALRERAELEHSRGNWERAAADLLESWQIALVAGDDALAAMDLVDTVKVLGHDLANIDAARIRVDDAAAMIERVRRFDPSLASSLEGELAFGRAQLEMRTRRFDAAIELFERSRERAVADSGHESLDEARILAALSTALTAKGEFEASLPIEEHVLAIYTERLGPHHPTTGHALNNTGLVLKHLARYEESARHFERAQVVLSASLREGHRSRQMVDLNLAEVYYLQRRYEEAIALYAPSFDAFEPEDIPHGYVLRRLSHYVLSLSRTGHWELARRLATLTRDRAEELDDPDTAALMEIELAHCDVAQGDPRAALARLDAMEPRLEAQTDLDGSRDTLMRGLALVARGEPGDRKRARTLLEDLRVLDSPMVEPLELQLLVEALAGPGEAEQEPARSPRASDPRPYTLQ